MCSITHTTELKSQKREQERKREMTRKRDKRKERERINNHQAISLRKYCIPSVAEFYFVFYFNIFFFLLSEQA